MLPFRLLPKKEMKEETELAKRRRGVSCDASVRYWAIAWSLLIIRDMMLRGCGGFRSYKGNSSPTKTIATNILADFRLRESWSFME